MSQTLWNPHNPGGAAPPQPGYQGGYPPQAYQAPGAPPGGYPPPQQAAPPSDLTSEGSLNDDVEFDILSSLPEQGLNESARFCFLLFDEKGDIRFRWGEMFYPQIGAKKFPFLAPPQANPLYGRCVDRWGFPRKRFASIVLAYYTDRQGNFIPNDSFKYSLHSLPFNNVQGPRFRADNKRRPFSRHDLMRTCTQAKTAHSGAEYQYSIEDSNVFSQLPDEMRAEILDKALFLHNTYLGPSIGRPRKDEEVALLIRDIDPSQNGPGGQQQQAPANLWGAAPGYGQPPIGYGAPPASQIQGPQPGYVPQYGQPPQAQPQGQPRPQHNFAPAPVQQAQQPLQPAAPQDFGAALTAASQQMPPPAPGAAGSVQADPNLSPAGE